MMPSFPVAGLMLAADCVAAAGVDILGGTLLWCGFPLVRTLQYRAVRRAGANARTSQDRWC
jgi:hypothetical protein